MLYYLWSPSTALDGILEKTKPSHKKVSSFDLYLNKYRWRTHVGSLNIWIFWCACVSLTVRERERLAIDLDASRCNDSNSLTIKFVELSGVKLFKCWQKAVTLNCHQNKLICRWFIVRLAIQKFRYFIQWPRWERAVEASASSWFHFESA